MKWKIYNRAYTSGHTIAENRCEFPRCNGKGDYIAESEDGDVKYCCEKHAEPYMENE